MSDVTSIINAAVLGDAEADARLLPLLYDELRRLAQGHMAREGEGHTLQTTALVHEAYLRLIGGNPVRFEDRKRFFALISEAMRRILIDHARRKRSLKCGGDRIHVQARDDLPEIATGHCSPEELLDLNEALERFEAIDPPKAQLVKLLYFAGMNLEDAATAMEISRATAHRDWVFARAWLRAAVLNAPAASPNPKS